MQIIFIFSTICVLFSTGLFLFTKQFLARISYKDISHPEDYQKGDVLLMKIVFTFFMILSFILMSVALQIMG